MKQKWKYFIFSILPFAIVLIAMVYMTGYLPKWGVQPKNMGSADWDILLRLIFCVVFVIVFGLIWFRRSVIFPPKNREADDSVPKRVPRKIVSVLLLGFSLEFLSVAVLFVSSRIFPGWTETLSSASSDLVASSAWLMLIYAVILGPVLEELIFRGLALGYARKVFPAWLAIVFQAALFGIYHWNLVQGIYAFVLGLFLGYICLKGPGIRYSILCHIVINFIATVLFTYISSFLSAYGPIVSNLFTYLVGFAGTFFFMWLFISATRVRKKQE